MADNTNETNVTTVQPEPLEVSGGKIPVSEAATAANTPEVAAPQAVLSGQTVSAPNNFVSPNPKMPTLKKPSVWQSVLTGALVGLAGGAGAKNFGEGMSGGVKGVLNYNQQQTENEERRQQLEMQKREQESRVKFQNAQAASMAADAAIKDAQLHALPQKLQDEHNTSAIEQIKAFQEMGLTPTLVVDNKQGGADAMAGLKQLTDSHGAVPPLHTIVMGDKIVAFDLNQLTQAPQALDTVNKIRAITGQQAYTPQQWGQLPKQAQVKMADEAMGFFAPTNYNEETYMQYKNYLNTAKAAPDSPEKAETVAKLTKVVGTLRSGIDEINKRETQQTATKAGAAASAAASVQRRYQNADLEEAARSIANDPYSLTSLNQLASMRGDERLRLFNAIKKINPDFDPGAIERKVKFLDGYMNPNGRSAINRQAINNVSQHAADLLDVNNEYRRSNVRVINMPLNKIREQYSSDYTRFETISNVLKDELKLYFAGGYAPTKEQEGMWNKIQNGDATPAQTEAFAREVIKLASRRASTFNSQFKAAMGYNDPNMITPDALAAAHKMGVTDLDQFGSGGNMTRPNGGRGNASAPKGNRPEGW